MSLGGFSTVPVAKGGLGLRLALEKRAR